jgi:hypothetical protein
MINYCFKLKAEMIKMAVEEIRKEEEFKNQPIRIMNFRLIF